MRIPVPGEWTTGAASAAGVLVGLAAVLGYVLAGLIVVGWGVTEFFARLTPEVLASLTLAAALAVALVAVPVAAFLHYRVVSPLVVLALVVVGWLVLGWAQGVLTARTVFGLAVYATYLAPVYLGLYLVFGWVEHRAHG